MPLSVNSLGFTFLEGRNEIWPRAPCKKTLSFAIHVFDLF